MSSLPGFLNVDGDFPAAFEMFSDMVPEESSSDEESASDVSDDDVKEEKPRPVRFRIEIPGRITAEKHLPSNLNE